MPYYTVTLDEVKSVARATVNALAAAGFRSCFVGSMACSRYGMRRVPKDIDIVVLTDQKTQEELKNLLVSADSHFYLVRSKDPWATYRVLWYRLSPASTYSYSRRSCKVDILLPGIMNIPSVPPQRIVRLRTGDLPLMPFLPLLLLKLQAWMDHGVADKAYLRDKQYVDVEDIDELLDLASNKYDVSLRTEKWMPDSFVREAKRRVVEYVRKFPDSRDSWRELGFSV